VVIDHVSEDKIYRGHPTPAMYGVIVESVSNPTLTSPPRRDKVRCAPCRTLKCDHNRLCHWRATKYDRKQLLSLSIP
jgi:hypothetical protein